MKLGMESMAKRKALSIAIGNRQSAIRNVRSRLAGVVWLLALPAIMIGCASAPIQPRPIPPSFRLVVLDFAIPAEWRNPETPDNIKKEMKGWWFGSRDVWRNPAMGGEAANLFAHELNRLPYVRLVSRTDTKYYMAGKRELIRRKLDEKRRDLEQSQNPDDRALALRIQNMTDADYDRELASLPPREIGRELEVDRVLTGRIHDLYLAHNRTLHWFWSAVDLEVNLLDVDSGKIIWNKRARFKKNLVSTSLLIEIAAQQMIEMMQRELFSQP